MQTSDGFKRLLLEYGSQQSIAVNKYHVYISIITKLCCTSITSCWFAIWKLNKLCSKKKNLILYLPKGAIQISVYSRRLHSLGRQKSAHRESEPCPHGRAVNTATRAQPHRTAPERTDFTQQHQPGDQPETCVGNSSHLP